MHAPAAGRRLRRRLSSRNRRTRARRIHRDRARHAPRPALGAGAAGPAQPAGGAVRPEGHQRQPAGRRDPHRPVSAGQPVIRSRGARHGRQAPGLSPGDRRHRNR